MEKITASSNEKIKMAVRLRQNSGVRRKSNLFFIEGARLCGDAAQSGIPVKIVFATAACMEKYGDTLAFLMKCAEKCYEITPELSRRLSDTDTPQGVFCICSCEGMFHELDKLEQGGKYIVLENVQDPANLGAISRTAEALGIDAAIVCGCCDLLNPKALRASMGSLFRLPVFKTDDMKDLFASAKEKGLFTITTTTDKTAVPIHSMDFSGGVLCIIGNEGNGVTQETMALCDEAVTIPMKGRAQSLNASMAACITMWEMLR